MTSMMETVQTACQIEILYSVTVTLGIRVPIRVIINIHILGFTCTLVKHVNSVMYIDSRNIVQNGAILILYLTRSVCITAVILIRITVYYNLGSSVNSRCRIL